MLLFCICGAARQKLATPVSVFRELSALQRYGTMKKYPAKSAGQILLGNS